MAHTADIHIKMDSATKTKATKVLNSLGMTATQAICLFFKQIIFTESIPFEIRIPNKVTVETFQKTDAGKDLHRVSGLSELKKELKS
jgi:DNA-damage-inducible protein J